MMRGVQSADRYLEAIQDHMGVGCERQSAGLLFQGRESSDAQVITCT